MLWKLLIEQNEGRGELIGVFAPWVTKGRIRTMINNLLHLTTNISKMLHSLVTWVLTGMKSIGFHRNQ